MLMVIGISVNAQKIYSVNADYKADVKVFVVDADYKADLLVYKVDSDYKAGKNDGKWFFTDADYKADKKIYFVDADYKADLKVYFVNSDYKAGWKNSAKKALLYWGFCSTLSSVKDEESLKGNLHSMECSNIRERFRN